LPSAERKKRAVAAKDRKQVLVYLDAELAKDLKMAAVQRETSASAIASDAISAWLKARGLLSSQKGS
jgi:hypothetical protein